MKTNKYKLYFVVFILLVASNIYAQKQSKQDTVCKTKYPIILVHGLGYRKNIIKSYWGKIPAKLQKKGANVFVANIDAFGTIESNAEQLQKFVVKIMKKTKLDKVNLIAHSKGGVDCRYMISKLSMDKNVASLTTVCTPHRGSFWAEVLIDWAEEKKIKKISNFLSIIAAYLMLDKNPEPWLAYSQLKIKNMNEFNKYVLDKPLVYYQSYGCIANSNYPNKSIKHNQQIINDYYGINDGFVHKSSYIWGDFKRVAGTEIDTGVSHFEIIGFTNLTKFNEVNFFANIVIDLKKMNF